MAFIRRTNPRGELTALRAALARLFEASSPKSKADKLRPVPVKLPPRK